ncbi:MAG: carboxymuconolactone decarboxylase family protein [Actinomycetaceae bacterium]|nr:carboxymuconolactone decarboxylase family protein [Actinomycetaceae bacterium]
MSDRIQRTEDVVQRLFGRPSNSGNGPDPEFWQILQRYLFGDLYHVGPLSDRLRELVGVTALTVLGQAPQLRIHTATAMAAGATPVEIREAVYQCAPFIGFPAALNAISAMNAAFEDAGIELPLPDQGQVTEENRYDKGAEEQAPLYGTRIADRYTWLPGEYAEFVPRILTEFGFGDFATRAGLPTKEREMLILVALMALGDTPLQIASHFDGGRKAGNSDEELIAALIHASAYCGIPRVFNALNIVRPLVEGQPLDQ